LWDVRNFACRLFTRIILRANPSCVLRFRSLCPMKQAAFEAKSSSCLTSRRSFFRQKDFSEWQPVERVFFPRNFFFTPVPLAQHGLILPESGPSGPGLPGSYRQTIFFPDPRQKCSGATPLHVCPHKVFLRDDLCFGVTVLLAQKKILPFCDGSNFLKASLPPLFGIPFSANALLVISLCLDNGWPFLPPICRLPTQPISLSPPPVDNVDVFLTTFLRGGSFSPSLRQNSRGAFTKINSVMYSPLLLRSVFFRTRFRLLEPPFFPSKTP